ncbi:MAG: VIT1/CCC1 transporter family protein [Candidatus Saganbacteria bacterium]|nr:VIT1/CCC1 transporter family protein [Candidatus Saganbacteria bacterium]
MKHSIKIGFCFGITSGIITTLGLMVGLNSSTHSEMVVIGGILTIALADSFSDALGIHVSEESENKHTTREIWEATFSTFFSKLIFALTFIVPILLFELPTAIVVNVVWGLSVLGFLSYCMAKEQQGNPWKAVFEHLLIALLVVILTYFVGNWIAIRFG